MIAYLDSSVLVRAYLVDEPGHAEVTSLLKDSELGRVTGTWTRIEVSGALVRAARAGRGDAAGLLELLDADLGSHGPVSVVAVDQEDIEDVALDLVRVHGLRAMDAWHLTVASLCVPSLLEPGEEMGFATRDDAQAGVAVGMGFRLV